MMRILLRKVDGVFTACIGSKYGTRVTATTAPPPSLAALALSFALLLLPVVAVLAAVASLLTSDPTFALATATAVVTKNREANELRAKARAIIDEITDPTKEFSVDEFNAK